MIPLTYSATWVALVRRSKDLRFHLFQVVVYQLSVDFEVWICLSGWLFTRGEYEDLSNRSRHFEWRSEDMFLKELE